MGSPIILVIIILLFVWCLLLSYFYWKLSSHYNSLIGGTNRKSLTAVLDRLTDELKLSKKDIEILKNRCDTIEKDSLFHIQKIGLVRFNPFKDTGGDQSFILSLLDAKDTGVVISGLFSRSGMRWYAKKVVRGEGIDHSLSDEEKKALKAAKTTQLL